MNFKGIEALLSIAEHGSFVAAAEALSCSKGYLSQQIKVLEDQYQTQLLIRTTRKVTLTSAGHAFITQCRDAINRIKFAEDNLLEEQTQLSGQINIASIGGIFGEQVVTPILLEFMQQNPEVSIGLNFSSSNVDLVNGLFDIAIRFGDLPDSSLIARKLLDYTPLLVASPSYIEKNGIPETPAELYQHQLIIGTRQQWDFQKGTDTISITPTPTLQCGNGYVMRESARKGLGITYLPSIYLEKLLNNQELISILPEWNTHTRPCNIIYPPGRYRLQRVRALVEYLISNVALNTTAEFDV